MIITDYHILSPRKLRAYICGRRPPPRTTSRDKREPQDDGQPLQNQTGRKRQGSPPGSGITTITMLPYYHITTRQYYNIANISFRRPATHC